MSIDGAKVNNVILTAPIKDMVKDKKKMKMMIDKVIADGAYDNIALYRLLEDNGIKDIVIKPRSNARDD